MGIMSAEPFWNITDSISIQELINMGYERSCVDCGGDCKEYVTKWKCRSCGNEWHKAKNGFVDTKDRQ